MKMNIWSGSIYLYSDHQLDGIRLVDPTTHWQCDISQDAKLRLQSFVNPALIPLHARAGPNLELHTVNEGSSQWLQRKLMGGIWLDEDELNLHQSLQCPVGLLVTVETKTPTKSSVFTSDILIYGVLSDAMSCRRPPTPPHSSPLETNEQTNTPSGKPYELRIYAAPLSTLLLTQAQAFPSPPPSCEHEHISTQAEFLPDISSPSPKRKRVATLFEVAAQHHRRVRQRGGEAVSQIMAPSRPLSSSQNLQSLRVKRDPDDELPSLSSVNRFAARRSRSVSIGPNMHRLGRARGTLATPGFHVDPQKRAPTPKSSLDTSQRCESLLTSTDEFSSSIPHSPPKKPEDVIAENKNLISRTVLTCMRLYGYHRSSIRPSTSKAALGASADLEQETTNSTPAPEGLPAETPAPSAAPDDDEFKNMYHVTYKAAAFALRKYLKDTSAPLVLEKGKAMTCIDELLRIFCEDH